MYMKWLTDVLLTRNRKKAMLTAGLCMVLAVSSGCALLPKEDAEEILPTINPPRLSQRPEYTVQTETLVTRVRGTGKLMSMNEQDAYFVEDNKRISGIYVKTGDQVTAGQLIAELDVSDVEAQLRQRKLQIRSDELVMIELLRNPGDRSAEQIEQARIDFELKRNEIVVLEESIARAIITAPISGEVVVLNYSVGDTSRAYEAVATIADLSQLTVAATISANDLEKVAVGMETVVDINVAGQHPGLVKQLPNPNASTQNQNPGYYYGYNQTPVRETLDQFLLVELEQMPENVTRGTPLSVDIIVQRKEDVVTIPLSTLRTITGRNYVQVAEPDGTKREVDVEIGMQTATSVEIVKGLTPGQKVVGR